jgi:hypothetical protein
MRWMLGLFEAGLFPGVNYYLSWYVANAAPMTIRIEEQNLMSYTTLLP